MALSRRQQMVSSIFLLVALMTFTAFLYRAFTEKPEVRLNESRRRADAAHPHRKSIVLADRALLMKDEAVTINRTRMIYRGLQAGAIRLDLYLLDLDPKYPYPKQIPREAAQDGFRLGNRKYKLLTVNRVALTLLFVK